MKHYINMDAEIKPGIRKTFDPSIGSLKKALYEIYKQYVYDDVYPVLEEERFIYLIENNIWDEKDSNNIWGSIQIALCEDPMLSKDLKRVYFDLENFCFCKHDGEEFGFGQLGDIAVLKCLAGGDWECPVYFVIYFDGKNLRAYIPTKGNTYNTETNTAFGNDDDDDLFFKNRGIEPGDYWENIDANTDAMIEDIVASIEIVETEDDICHDSENQSNCVKLPYGAVNNSMSAIKNIYVLENISTQTPPAIFEYEIVKINFCIDVQSPENAEVTLLCKKKNCDHTDLIKVPRDEINKTAFLTKEMAEKKLKELKNDM